MIRGLLILRSVAVAAAVTLWCTLFGWPDVEDADEKRPVARTGEGER